MQSQKFANAAPRPPRATINQSQLYLCYLGQPLLILKRAEPLRLIPVLVFVALASFCLIIFNETSCYISRQELHIKIMFDIIKKKEKKKHL